ncbi:hypothetical protein EON76_04835 [bacterium]|nr:MAG: hypothetical protein EON76_04835 [bacterium]
MLETIGFLLLAVAVGAYAYTSAHSYHLVPSRHRQLFTSAYSILSLTAIVWLIALAAPASATSGLVFMSDVMLIAATVCILGTVLDLARPFLLSVITVIAAGILTFRAFVAPPNAYVSEGLLNFNLTQIESLVIGLIFLAVWLPATVKVVYAAFNTPHMLPLRGLIAFACIGTVLMTSFFISARRPIITIISLFSIVLFFGVLTAINFMLQRNAHVEKKEVNHG